MPGFNVERKNFLTIKQMMPNVVSDMIANGFELLYPADVAVLSSATGNYKFDENGVDLPTTGNLLRQRWAAILKAGTSVNSLSEAVNPQEWVIKFEWDDAKYTDTASPSVDSTFGGKLDVFVCTPLQVNIINGMHTYFAAKASKIESAKISLGSVGGGDEPFSYLESLGMCGTNLSYASIIEPGKTSALSYYNKYEVDDETGYDKDLAGGDNSYPAIARNKHTMAKHFYYRSHIRQSEVATYPMSYIMSITDRGLFFSIWEQTSDEVGNRNSWVLVQRPVDHQTGQTYVTGKAPVHCMYQIMTKYVNRTWLPTDCIRAVTGASGTPSATINAIAPKAVNIRRFIVREDDIEAPYPTPRYIKDAFALRVDYAEGGFPFGVDATQNTPDYAAVINDKQQVAISENNKYVLTFPNGFNTARYAYTHECDMIAYTSADVISADTEVEITVYGEATPRKYKALRANGPNNTGMRILVLKSGGGISS